MSENNPLIENNLFYSVLKNEDANPYIGDNIIIVADGLGGSGSTVHNVVLNQGENLRKKLFKSAFCGFSKEAEEKIKPQLDKWIAPLLDGEPHTSALWGSRIAIARCAYALECNPDFSGCDLSDEEVRAKLVDYISSGLKKAVETFNFQKGRFENQALLPTTLAFMKYSVDVENQVTNVEVLWAGDSRCYVLTTDGLKQLSIDDEDSSGAITNLFFAGDNKKTILNYRKYTIKNPCVLSGVSDGIFDPFEPHDGFGVEKTILDKLNEANDYPELMSKLYDFYCHVHSDDATMAFVPIGFVDYSDLKTRLAERTEKLLVLWNKFFDFNLKMEAEARSEEVIGYVKSRTSDKFDSIMSLLFENYDPNNKDWKYPDKIRTIINRNRKKEINDNLDKLLSEIKEGDIKNPEEILKPKRKQDGKKSVTSPFRLESLEATAHQKYNSIKECEKMDQIEKHRGTIDKYINDYWTFFSKDNNMENWEERARTVTKLGIWMNLKLALENGRTDTISNKPDILKNEEKKATENIKGFITKNKSLLESLFLQKYHFEDLENCRSEYVKSITAIIDLLKKDNKLCKDILNKKIIDKYNLSEKSICPKYDSSELFEYKKQDLINNIVKALVDNYDKESPIDSIYNASKLVLFRTYYRLQRNPETDLGEFEKELEELEAGYEELIKDTKN